MRLFVGIAIANGVKESISSYLRRLEGQLSGTAPKWVRPESLHVTLKFIGETQSAEEIKNQLRTVSSARIAMHFRGVGFFTPHSPRIFWAGVVAGPELEALATSIEDKLFSIGIPKEPHAYQGYQPHVTLARTGSGRPQGNPQDRNKVTMKALQESLTSQPPPNFGTMTAEEFILFRSETLPSGPRYTPLERFPLK